MGAGPLEGVRVVELASFVAVPSCGRLLADQGAEVIKIEALAGDPWRATGMSITHTGPEENPVYDIYNIGKQNICLNIKTEKGAECLRRMLEGADVFLTNVRPRSLKKLGLDAETLHERCPRLICASLNGFGPKGPEADRAGFDNVAFWARSGFSADMVPAESPYPLVGPTGIGDTIAGGILLSGILAALYRREKTGKGEIVETSLYASAIWSMASMIVGAQPKYGWKLPKERTDITPVNMAYRCADGKWLNITILEYARYAESLYEVLGIREAVAAMGITDYASMRAHTAEMQALIGETLMKRPAAEWLPLLQAADIVADEVAHFRDVAVSEQAWANGYLEEYRFRNGDSCVLPCPPVRLASYEKKPSACAPMPGENSEKVLKELGYLPEEIAEMARLGAVRIRESKG